MAISEIKLPAIEPYTHTPTVETSVFDDMPNAKFWIGKVAILGETVLEKEYTAARQLRANIYIDKMGFLSEESRQPDGGESDEDDDRSIHFAVIENNGEEKRLVGTSRLIVKRSEDDLLPAEKLFPEAFTDIQAKVGSTEASRFIAEHPDKFTKHMISLSEIRAMDLEALDRGFEPIYAVIESKLANMFKYIGLPFQQITEIKHLEEYDTPNMAVEIDPKKVKEEVKKDLTQQLLLTHFFQDALISLGLGYYDEGLQKPLAA